MNNSETIIAKDLLIDKISQTAGISVEKAKQAYETILLESPSFRQEGLKTVEATKELVVPVPGEKVIEKVELNTEKAVITETIEEKIKVVEVKVPVEKIVEVIKEVEVVKEVPVEKIVEVIKTIEVEVPVEVEKVVEVVKEVEVIKEVPVEVIKTEIKEVEVVKEVPVEVIKEITLIREVEKRVEIIKEVPVEIIREVEVVKQIDFAQLQQMMEGMKTVEVSKTVVGETRNVKESKIVERREVESRFPKVDDDLTKIEGVGPKIAELLNKGGLHTFRDVSRSNPAFLKKILDDAGPRFTMHVPDSWPRQAALAANGDWDTLEKLQDELQGGR